MLVKVNGWDLSPNKGSVYEICKINTESYLDISVNNSLVFQRIDR